MVCNVGMNHQKLIEHLGGPTKLAALLGFVKPGSAQRVQNWIERGIPAQVQLDFPHLFQKPPARFIQRKRGV